MRRIDKIILHCSATLPGQRVDVETITLWHKQRGFKTIGYHFFIDRSGTIHAGRPLEQQGAHCKGQNAHSIGICYEGGLDYDGCPADTRTPQQRTSLDHLLTRLKAAFPQARIVGHNQLNPHKACPCFEVL